MGRFVGMIMVSILVTQNFAVKAIFSYKNIDDHDHEAHDQLVSLPLCATVTASAV